MAIFDKGNRIFIHIPRTAGTSITEKFKKFNLRQEDFKHKTYIDYKKELGEDFEKYRIFSIVRNPYSRLVSYFNYHLFNSRLESIIDLPIPMNVKFSFYLNKIVINKDIRLSNRGIHTSKTQTSYLIDENKKINNNLRIIKYENIKKEKLPKINISKLNLSIKDLYSKSDIEIVREHFMEDFINFKYDIKI